MSYEPLIHHVCELSKCERLIFEKNYKTPVDSQLKNNIKKHSELYELLHTLTDDELLHIYNLAFHELSNKRAERDYYINSLYFSFELDKTLSLI